MTWNYRVVKTTIDDETWFAIHEAYYDDDVTITQDGVAAYGESVEELRQELERMLAALDKPVLDYEDF